MRIACQSPFPFVFIALAGAIVAGCERKPEPLPGAAEPVAAEQAGQTPRPDTPVVRAASAVRAAGEVGADEQPAAAVLGQRLRAAEEAYERAEIVGELWELATPEAVEILRQRFFIEPDVDVKADIVAGLVDEQKPQTREVRFGILAAALAPTQSIEVRETAVSMLVEFDDVRAVALLQNLLSDPNEEIREAAREAIEARREREAR